MNRGVLLSSFLGYKGRSGHIPHYGRDALRVGACDDNKTLPSMGAIPEGRY
jgi:hypothetical protein